MSFYHPIMDILAFALIVVLSVYSVYMYRAYMRLIDDYAHLWKMNQ